MRPCQWLQWSTPCLHCLVLGRSSCTYTSFAAWEERYEWEREALSVRPGMLRELIPPFYLANSFSELSPAALSPREGTFQHTRSFFDGTRFAHISPESLLVSDFRFHARGQHNIRVLLDLMDSALMRHRPAFIIDELRSVILNICTALHYRPVAPLPPALSFVTRNEEIYRSYPSLEFYSPPSSDGGYSEDGMGFEGYDDNGWE